MRRHGVFEVVDDREVPRQCLQSSHVEEKAKNKDEQLGPQDVFSPHRVEDAGVHENDRTRR